MSKKVSQLIQVLEELQNVDYKDPHAARKHDDNANTALRLIFHIGREKIEFTEEQKVTVAENLVKALKPIQINIEGHGFEFLKRLNTTILKKRSALQFLIDTYGTFPVGSQTLSDIFEQRNLKDTIGILEEIIQEFRNASDEDSSDDSDGAYSDRDFPGIPTSHYWWS